ncbi:hypothetical protein KKC97_09380 [bacterium]|nr:hypothetical protein [bacterium]MBU1919578.1 hypothetical protein [bacterium]
MYSLDRERILFSCPVCHKDLLVVVQELYSKKKIGCRECGCVLDVPPDYAVKVKSALSDLDEAKRKVRNANKRFQRMMLSAVTKAAEHPRHA